jgi:1-acyl-sn-glycerol-3-phosphate acyltransferase
MTEHSEIPSTAAKIDGTIGVPPAESSIGWFGRAWGHVWYWWSLSVAGALLLIFGPPSISWAIIRRRPMIVYPWAHWGGRMWLKLSRVRVVVHGLEKLSDDRSYVFASNHRSYLDTATIFVCLGRVVGLIAKKEVLKVPVLGYGMGFVNVLAIDRSNNVRAVQTMREATNRLRGGLSIAVFAEGTRAMPGQLLPFKKGPFYMAVEAGVPVVPVAIAGSDQLMGKRSGTAFPGTIDVMVLDPISTVGMTTDDVTDLSKRANAAVAEALAAFDEQKNEPTG